MYNSVSCLFRRQTFSLTIWPSHTLKQYCGAGEAGAARSRSFLFPKAGASFGAEPEPHHFVFLEPE
jgi:hypothetical protein